jgi:hypothetical protein
MKRASVVVILVACGGSGKQAALPPSAAATATPDAEATLTEDEPGSDCAVLPVLDAGKARITGRVVDASGKPAAGVTITVVHPDVEPTASSPAAMTDANGAYDTGELRPGQYDLVVAQGVVAFRPTRCMLFRGGATQTIDVRLPDLPAD